MRRQAAPVRATHRAAALLAVLAATLTGPAPAAEGSASFKQHCAPCHQESASGTVGLAPALLGEHWQRLGAERRYLPSVMLHGLAGPIKVGGAPFVGAMPGLAAQLGDEELAAIASHLRRLQGAAGEAPYTAAEFEALRRQGGSPPQSRALRRQVLGD